jgi:hypothetical protein
VPKPNTCMPLYNSLSSSLGAYGEVLPQPNCVDSGGLLRRIPLMIPLTGSPSSGRPRIMVVSCKLTVISPHGRWKEWVFRRHRSTKADNNGPSITGNPRTTTKAMSKNPALAKYWAYLSSQGSGKCSRTLNGFKS